LYDQAPALSTMFKLRHEIEESLGLAKHVGNLTGEIKTKINSKDPGATQEAIVLAEKLRLLIENHPLLMMELLNVIAKFEELGVKDESVAAQTIKPEPESSTPVPTPKEIMRAHEFLELIPGLSKVQLGRYGDLLIEYGIWKKDIHFTENEYRKGPSGQPLMERKYKPEALTVFKSIVHVFNTSGRGDKRKFNKIGEKNLREKLANIAPK